MSPSDRRKQVLNDLKSILAGPASSNSIITKPYVSSYAGLCRRDIVYLAYSRNKSGRFDSPLKPVGINNVVFEYHLLSSDDTGSPDDWHSRCEQLSTTEVKWVQSDSDPSAQTLLKMLEEAVANVREKKNFAISCKEPDSPEKENKCAAAFLAAAPEVHAAYFQTVNCFVVGAGEYDITIVSTDSNVPQGKKSFMIAMEPISNEVFRPFRNERLGLHRVYGQCPAPAV